MNKEKIKKLIENAGRAKRKSASDLRIINNAIKEGCPNCKLRPKETHQNQLPALPELSELPELLNDLQVDFAMPGPAPKS